MSEVEVSTHIAASAERVWELIGNPTRMGEWSPECRELAWLGGAEAAAIGVRFSGRNRSGWRHWTTSSTIVTFEPGREISWEVEYNGLPVSRWSYRIDSHESGTSCLLVEVFEDRRGIAFTLLGPIARGVIDVEAHNRANMEQTLQQIKAAAESSP